VVSSAVPGTELPVNGGEIGGLELFEFLMIPIDGDESIHSQPEQPVFWIQEIEKIMKVSSRINIAAAEFKLDHIDGIPRFPQNLSQIVEQKDFTAVMGKRCRTNVHPI
jgi:hypothetical protein